MIFDLDPKLVRSLTQAVAAAPARRGGPDDREPRAVVTPSESGSGEAGLDDAAAALLFARAAWSAVTEPGDAVAGTLVAGLGPGPALTMLIERRESRDWLAASADGEHELRVADVEAALERWEPRLSSRVVVGALRAAARFEARLLTPEHPLWPVGCDDLGPHAPHALWVRGDVTAVDHPAGGIALVGSRDATSYGEHVAMELASGLSDRGFAVVSGAAYGIDGMAHRAALVSGGKTVAFLAGGVDRLYPAAHHDLLLRVAAQGAIVSELPCGTSPTKWRFLQRNRLIAAITQATVVVEAGHRSGSLNTAGHAAALGRPLGAVPGPVTSVTSAGCHRLLREFDATCVTSATEVVELVLGPATPLRDPAAAPSKAANAGLPVALTPASASLGKASAPPGRASASAGEASASPGVASASPGEASASAGVASASPRDASATPGKASASAGVASASPGKASASAGVASASPEKASASAGVASATPGEVSASEGGSGGDGDGVQGRVLDALSRRSRRTPADIAARAGLAVRAVEAALGVLSLEGRARETPTGWIRAPQTGGR